MQPEADGQKYGGLLFLHVLQGQFLRERYRRRLFRRLQPDICEQRGG